MLKYIYIYIYWGLQDLHQLEVFKIRKKFTIVISIMIDIIFKYVNINLLELTKIMVFILLK